MIKVGIIGSTGYAGVELVRILLQHKEVKIVWYGSKSYIDKEYSSVYQSMFRIVDDILKDDNINELVKEVDVIFTATPQGFLSELLTMDVLNKVKVIDLSADFRIKDVNIYEKWYGIKHNAKELIKDAVYGLCELNRESIKGASFIANPGCYPTCSILTITPLLKAGLIDPKSIIIDAKSATSGAGRGQKLGNLYCEVNESIKAYGVTSHRHTPEIEEQLSNYASSEVIVNFTPHLVPMNRGILVTAYGNLVKNCSYDELIAIYKETYKDETFIRILDKDITPETRWVRASNYVDINLSVDQRTNRVIMMGAIDNLVKGAAGQAVQNMNILFGLAETEGLQLIPMFP